MQDQISGIIDNGNIERIQSIVQTADEIMRAFAGLAAPLQARESIFEDYAHLKIAMDEPKRVILIEHFGTTIRFECLIALESQKAVGRVVCSVERPSWEDRPREILGVFHIRGFNTDLPGNSRGQPTKLPHDSDLIVGYFLDKAHLSNLNFGAPK